MKEYIFKYLPENPKIFSPIWEVLHPTNRTPKAMDTAQMNLLILRNIFYLLFSEATF